MSISVPKLRDAFHQWRRSYLICTALLGLLWGYCVLSKTCKPYRHCLKTWIKVYSILSDNDRKARYDSLVHIVGHSHLPDYFTKILPALAIVESDLNPCATSNVWAAWLWQLMPATAREYGLIIDTTTDQRYDLTASTYAAIQHINTIMMRIHSSPAYSTLTSYLDCQKITWNTESLLYPLVIIAYHAGERHVTNMIKKYPEFLYTYPTIDPGETCEIFLTWMIQRYATTPWAQQWFHKKFWPASAHYYKKVTTVAAYLDH